MASLSANAFKVEVADPSSSSSRAARRVVLSVEILRACKISTGDVVRISSINEPLDVSSILPPDEHYLKVQKLNAPFALGIVWPSSEISQTGICLQFVKFRPLIFSKLCGFRLILSLLLNSPKVQRLV